MMGREEVTTAAKNGKKRRIVHRLERRRIFVGRLGFFFALFVVGVATIITKTPLVVADDGSDGVADDGSVLFKKVVSLSVVVHQAIVQIDCCTTSSGLE